MRASSPVLFRSPVVSTPPPLVRQTTEGTVGDDQPLSASPSSLAGTAPSATPTRVVQTRRRGREGACPQVTVGGAGAPPEEGACGSPSALGVLADLASIPVKRFRKQQSPVWEYMEKRTCITETGEQRVFAKCKVGGCRWEHPRSGSTISTHHIAQHLQHKHKIVVDISRRSLGLEETFRLNRTIAVSLLLLHWPLRTTATLAFQYLVGVLHGGFIPVSPATLMRKHIIPMHKALCGLPWK